MFRFISLLMALLYCLVWFRIPELGGISFPFQRLIAWLGFVCLVLYTIYSGKIYLGRTGKVFFVFVVIFFSNLVANFLWSRSTFSNFGMIYFIMDVSKYLAAFSMAYLVYFVLSKKMVREERFIKYLIYSGVFSVIISLVTLCLYLAGIRVSNDILIRSFDGAWGVWPTGQTLPRLAGTTAEPQQLSIIFLTPILLLMSKNKGKLSFIALLGIAVLLLSQSKFSLLSALIIFLYSFIVNKRRRFLLIYVSLFSLPFILNSITKLAVFSNSMEEGLSSGAFQERFENGYILLDIIKNHFFFGIGAGQYGAYKLMLFPSPELTASYTPNNDYLKIFAELGLLGIFVTLYLFFFLIRRSVKSYKFMNIEQKQRFLAVLLGSLGIVLNMMIGYEFLHVFFWVNVGLIMYMCDSYRKSSDTTKQITEITPMGTTK